jgi:hypothetical protein
MFFNFKFNDVKRFFNLKINVGEQNTVKKLIRA